MSAGQPKMGRPRASTKGVHAGAHVLLAGEWLKVLRGVKGTKEGKAFLAMPQNEQDQFFRRLAVIASMPVDFCLYKPGLSNAIKQVREIRLKWWGECSDKFPKLTGYALKRLRARVNKLNGMPSDFIEAGLGYFSDKEGNVTRDSAGLSQEARDGLLLLREEETRRRNKSQRGVTKVVQT